ncbi:MAG: OB-fold domain-containing protein [Pseudomonadales bacterium]|jgi:uncharacterized OB-fold protein
MSDSYLNPGLPQPVPASDGLDTPFWKGLQEEKILLQKCVDCNSWQWGPEWICHRCHSENVEYSEVPGEGIIYSYERVWHPVHPALKEQGPYIVVLVEIPEADHVRLVGNLLGDAHQEVKIGSPVSAAFEHHADAEPSFTLLQWRCSD